MNFTIYEAKSRCELLSISCSEILLCIEIVAHDISSTNRLKRDLLVDLFADYRLGTCMNQFSTPLLCRLTPKG